MKNSIHPTAIIDPSAHIGTGCSVGPYSIIGAKVVIGDNCTIHPHVVIDGNTHIGDNCEIYSFAAIGNPTPDLKYKGEDTHLRIGKNNVIREQVTINPGTVQDKGITRIGDGNLLMVGVHVAHDCIIGDGNIFANNATLAGHVVIGNNVVIGGMTAFHQYVRIGDYAMIGGMSGVEHDVIPFGLVMGERARLAGLNLVGLDRRGFDKAEIKILMKVFKDLFLGKDGNFKDRLAHLTTAHADNETVSFMLDFANAEHARPLCQPK